eukprot:851892-Rhodomonas_salina.1
MHKAAITTMHSEQIRDRDFLRLKRCRKKFDRGGEGEIQRFLQKTAPRSHMWGVLPRDKVR